ncbi:hypothetical protein SAMN02746068_01395 [Lactococcus chungangensis CAU 28 = DSM 22330]|nr:hypothetical protein [Lactococcus chungangensis]SFZ74865.1 hypothetical protein SAMN02746068_01395 [Lactococcus chungangensis CAU 28 = DSM 22330]
MKKYLFIIPIVLLVGLSACEKISNDERKKSNVQEKTSKQSSTSSSSSQEESKAKKNENSSEVSQEHQESVKDSSDISKNQQEATPSSESSQNQQELKWESMDEAILFWEKVYKNTQNEVSKKIEWKNYNVKNWSLTENNGSTILLHWSNESGAGGSYTKFTKKTPNETQIVEYDGNASYPQMPSYSLLVQNSNYLVLETMDAH